MDEILYLEPDEEITSVIDKIKNAKSGRLGLVVPREATLLQSVVNLRLLEREAASLSKEIAIVTTDKIGRNLAAQVGLQVFNSIEEQKPVYQPPPAKPDPDEVIELNETLPKEEDAEVAGVKVHHFQEKPVIWRKNQAPVFRAKNEESAAKANSIQKTNVGKILGQKEKDFLTFHKLIWPITAVILILIGIATYLLLPKATITITVPSENLKKSLTLAISSQTQTPDINANIVPGQLIQVSDEKKDTFTATGTENIGTKATGTITLYNTLDSSNHSLATGSQLSSSSKTFILKSAVTIPGASVQGGNIVPGTVKVNIEASDVGSEYNVKAGRFTILSLTSAQQAGIYGQSSQDLTGGDSRQVQVVSQQDYDTAKNKLIKVLSDSTNQKLKDKINGKKIIDKALVIPDPIVTSSAAVNSEAKSFDMDIKYSQQVMVFDNPVLKDTLEKILSKQVAQDKMVAIASDNDIGLAVNKTAYDKGELDLNVNVVANIAAKMDVNMIKTNVLGKSSSSAESYIKTQPGVSKVNVDFWPALWFKRIPNLARNVTINVHYENK